MENANTQNRVAESKIILDLCGGTGSWSRPYATRGGYSVIVVTLPRYDLFEVELADGKIILHDRLTTIITEIPADKVYGILAAPPCTEFSILNCIDAPRERDEAAGMEVVNACKRIIDYCAPKFWAIENPRGFLRKYLGNPQLTFQPWQYGDPWTKATDIWGNFTPPAPLYEDWNDVPKLPLYTRPGRGKPNFAFLHKSAWEQIPQLHFHRPETDAEFRAMTPPGFAEAFCNANE